MRMSLHWIRTADYDAMSMLAAAHIAQAIQKRLRQKCPMLLGLATGNTMLTLYERLAGLLNERGTHLEQLHTVNLDEYVGADRCWVPDDHPLSYHAYMEKNFFKRLDPKLGMRPEHIHFPDPLRPGELDEMLVRMGRLDFQLLGIGFNGHIAFNEPISAAEIEAEGLRSPADAGRRLERIDHRRQRPPDGRRRPLGSSAAGGDAGHEADSRRPGNPPLGVFRGAIRAAGPRAARPPDAGTPGQLPPGPSPRHDRLCGRSGLPGGGGTLR